MTDPAQNALKTHCPKGHPYSGDNLYVPKSGGKNCRQCEKLRKRVPGYRVWMQMIQRCHNPNDQKYYIYGARGIAVCERWRKSFSNFIADMGPKPSADMSIDRIDNNGNYEPSNCRWATREQQQRNTSRNHLIEFCGVIAPLCYWSEKVGINRHTLSRRIRSGWSIERTLTEKVREW